MHREALFDLAVGSLFHEAMKFRENFYQREVYGPRVLALRSEAGEEEGALFDEFERIQEGVSARLEEGLIETEGLLERTVEQLRRLLAAHADDPLVARLLFVQARPKRSLATSSTRSSRSSSATRPWASSEPDARSCGAATTPRPSPRSKPRRRRDGRQTASTA
jgi:hypothetical protein